jgi:anhydro-N-acetylmuramic acid kinase
MKYSVIGLMSGTSMDGLDIAWCEFKYLNETWHFKIKKAVTNPYSKEWEDLLRKSRNLDRVDLNKLDVLYGKLLAVEVSKFIAQFNIGHVDFVASHGHTVHHKPEEGVTIQIGNGIELSRILGIDVIYDFRMQDVQLFGQGAPLVPIGDQLLFSQYESCLNLGGFANISFSEKGERLAFDICPVNIVMNYYAGLLNLPYDDGGNIARGGNTDPMMLKELNNLAYYKMEIPKSLGVEWVDKYVFPLINNSLGVKDILRTLIEHVVCQIQIVLKKYKINSILITGGGAFNTFLIERLIESSESEIIIPSSEVVNYKEAMVFGFLGVLRIRNEVNVLKSVTGAKYDHCSGKITRNYV